MVDAPNFRKLWFEHVAKTRRKGQRKDKSYTHRDAMKEASVTWPKIKDKIERKHKRDLRKASRLQRQAQAAPKTEDTTSGSQPVPV